MANIPLPSYRLSRYQLGIEKGNRDQRYARGRVVSTVNVHDPIWSLDIQTAPMYFSEARAWDRFFDVAEQPDNRVLADPTFRKPPQAYPNGGGTDPEIQVRTLTATSFSVIDLPGDYRVRASDIVRFKDGNNYHLARVQATVNATAGGNATISFWPPIPTSEFAPFSATAAFENIEMIWRLVPGSVQHDQDVVHETFSFRLESVLK